MYQELYVTRMQENFFWTRETEMKNPPVTKIPDDEWEKELLEVKEIKVKRVHDNFVCINVDNV